MTDRGEIFINESRNLLKKYLLKIEKCLEILSDEDIWRRANEASNSIGNLILHLEGNVNQWMIGGVGNLPFERERQQEFDERRMIPKAELLERLRAITTRTDGILESLDITVLTESREIQGRNVTLLQAVYHVVEHFSMHTGQIILLTKMLTGKDLHLFN